MNLRPEGARSKNSPNYDHFLIEMKKLTLKLQHLARVKIFAPFSQKNFRSSKQLRCKSYARFEDGVL